MKTLEGNLLPPTANSHYGIIAGKFNSFVVESLVSGAIGALKQHGVSEDQITVVYVPGAFEIPLATQQLAETKKFNALIALGAVIRGSTPHFDYVAGECTKGISVVGRNTQGVNLIRLSGEEKLVGLERIEDIDEPDVQISEETPVAPISEEENNENT